MATASNTTSTLTPIHRRLCERFGLAWSAILVQAGSSGALLGSVHSRNGNAAVNFRLLPQVVQPCIEELIDPLLGQQLLDPALHVVQRQDFAAVVLQIRQQL